MTARTHTVVPSPIGDLTLVAHDGGLDRKRFLLALEESGETRATRLF